MDKIAYTLDELAEQFQVTTRTLRTYIKNGKLKAVKIGTRWIVSAENLNDFINGKNNDES